MRKIKVIAVLLVFAMLFAGCNLVEVNEDRDMQRIVAKVEGKTITKEEYANAYYYNIQMYMYYYGYTVDDLTTDEMTEYLQEYAIESMINQKIMEVKAEEYGCYDFTQEELDEIDLQYTELIDTYRESAKNTVEADEANADKSEDELSKLIDEELDKRLEDLDIDKEGYLQSLKDQKAVEKLEDIITETQEPAESELQAVYDEKVAAQEASYTQDPTTYDSALNSGETIYYNLPDTRQTSHILIALPDEVQTEINTLRSSGDDEGADALREEELAKIKEKADEVYALAAEGQDFAELIAEYGEDPGMETNDYYTVIKDVTSFAPEYMDALFALENEGDFTELVATDFGYHIILYVKELPSGAVAFEDVKDGIRDEIVNAEKEELYAEKLSTWREEAKVKIYNSRLDIDID